jgi:hypothetical protein
LPIKTLEAACEEPFDARWRPVPRDARRLGPPALGVPLQPAARLQLADELDREQSVTS